MDSSIKSPPGVWPNHQGLWLDTNIVSLPRGKPVRRIICVRAKPGDSVYFHVNGDNVPIYSPQTYWSAKAGSINTRSKSGLIELVIGPATSLNGCTIAVNHELREVQFIKVSVYESKE